MTAAENHAELINAARTDIEFRRAVNTARNASTSEIVASVDDSLAGLVFGDGSELSLSDRVATVVTPDGK